MSEDVFIDMLEDDEQPEDQVLAAATCSTTLAGLAAALERKAGYEARQMRLTKWRGWSDQCRAKASAFREAARMARQCSESDPVELPPKGGSESKKGVVGG